MRHASRVTFAVAAVAAILAGAQCARRQDPSSANASKVRPSELQTQNPRPPAPRLAGTGDEARRAVAAFLAWAGASTTAQREDGRREIAAAATNPDIVRALTDEITRARQTDHSRALLGLSVLGEMRSPHAFGYLRDFVRQPLPAPKTLVEGEDPEQTAVATLQAKAVAGLAYMNTTESNAEVFWAVGTHASRIVRAEAIRTYLANHQGSEEARATLRKYIRKGEEIFLDRPNRDPEERAASFNQKLELYLRAHPDLAPPVPERDPTRVERGPGGNDYRQGPPRF